MIPHETKGAYTMTSMQKREMWPVMLTPFTSGGSVDFDSLARLIDFYEETVLMVCFPFASPAKYSS